MGEFALTTTDNPWNPITHFDEWWVYDTLIAKYMTCSYIARLTQTSELLGDKLNDEEIERVIDEIVEKDLISLETGGKVHYRKVVAA